MARYSLFVLKVPLNPKQTNKQTVAVTQTYLLAYASVQQPGRLAIVSRNVGR